MRMMIHLPLLLLLVATGWIGVSAHRSLPSGVSCSSQFFSPEAALTVPNPKVSWASYRIFTCDEKIFWLEAQAEANQKLAFTALVPVLERFAEVRMTVAFIGPSLPALTDDADVPQEVRDYSASTGLGVAVFRSPEDQSTCDHLTAEPMIAESAVVDNRCHFFERFSGSNSWVLLDQTLEAVEAGNYKIAVYVEGDTTAKASFACCDWPEDFVTNYPLPEVDCPFCGTSPEENPAWASHFYEQKSMEQYGGFPPFESCDDPGAQDLAPTEEQCPPITTDEDAQPPSCNLGCNADGLCHSHNVLGECTHQLTWDLEPKFGEAPVSEVIIFKGDEIKFQGGGAGHNLFEMPTEDSLDLCDFTGAVATANVEEVFVGHKIAFDEAGTYYFTCGIGCTGFPTNEGEGSARQGCHCDVGQKLTVEVKDSSEGIRCHDHAPLSNEDVPELMCGEGQVLAFTIDNAAYGAMNENECAEFCTPDAALQFMTGVEEGTCADEGFTGNVVETTVTVPTGQDITVLVTTKEEASTCHCHSYEEISCPADEAPGDTLYEEHIDEIEDFCTGILDGTETDCPYPCFQPMEVLHLHYIECPSREVDPTYLQVNATGKCHIAAAVPPGEDCPVVALGGEPDDVDPIPIESFQLTPVNFPGCIEANGHNDDDMLILQRCDAGDINQQWEYDSFDGLIRATFDDGTSLCMQAGRSKMPPDDGAKIRLVGCDEDEPLQIFDWSSALGSAITLRDYSEYCMMFRGGSADLGVDPILVKKCSALEEARLDGWMAM